VTSEDLEKFGLIPEFIGRLPVISVMDELGVDDLVQILQTPKNSLVKQYQKLFKFEKVKLSFDDEGTQEGRREGRHEKGRRARAAHDPRDRDARRDVRNPEPGQHPRGRDHRGGASRRARRRGQSPFATTASRASPSPMKSGLLIAAPTMKDRWFEQAVVLLCQFNSEGALGLVVNKDGPVTIGDVVERLELGIAATRASSDEHGGADPSRRAPASSCGAGAWRRRRAGTSVTTWRSRRRPSVSGASSRAARSSISASATPDGHRGQLDHEIQTGSWLFADLDSSILFDTPLGDRWERALGLLGLTRETVWMKPVDE
jgi:putative AlgH/UPF0301 family transcriptional regulator